MLLTLVHYVRLELLLEHVERTWAALEEAVHEFDVMELVLLKCLYQPRVVHSEKCQGVGLDVFFEELIDDLVVGRWVQVAVDAVLLLVEALAGLQQVGVARVLGDVEI